MCTQATACSRQFLASWCMQQVMLALLQFLQANACRILVGKLNACNTFADKCMQQVVLALAQLQLTAPTNQVCK